MEFGFCSSCGAGDFRDGYLVRRDHAGTRNHSDFIPVGGVIFGMLLGAILRDTDKPRGWDRSVFIK